MTGLDTQGSAAPTIEGEVEQDRRSSEHLARRRAFGETLAKWSITRRDIDAMPSREREAAERVVTEEVEAKLANKA